MRRRRARRRWKRAGLLRLREVLRRVARRAFFLDFKKEYERKMAQHSTSWAFDAEAARAEETRLAPGGFPSQFVATPKVLANKRDELREWAAYDAYGLAYWFRIRLERTGPTHGIGPGAGRGWGTPPAHAEEALAAYTAHHRRMHEAYLERGEAERRRNIEQHMARQHAEAARIRAMSADEFRAFTDDLERKRELKWEAIGERDRLCDEYPDCAAHYRNMPLSFFREDGDAADRYDRSVGYDLDTGEGTDDDAPGSEGDGGSDSSGPADSLAGVGDDGAAAGSDGERGEEGEDGEWGWGCDDDEGLFAAAGM
jgi:hypothetical protein